MRPFSETMWRAGSRDDWFPPVLAVLAWFPAMAAASYIWLHGDYYDYGWFVPPAAIWLTVLRWRESAAPVTAVSVRTIAIVMAVLIPWVLVLRILGHVDPLWRLPIGLLGFTAVLAWHAVLAGARGWRESAGFVWITLLWCSALPWPSMLESAIVHHLTRNVVEVVAEVFQVIGKPVDVLGDRLQLHDLTVEVTDGCSGVRSFQSFLMATWFFAELQRLRAAKVLILLMGACGAAFAVNVARTYALAAIRFDHGELAFERAHDMLGLLAFLVSATFFYLLSGWLGAGPRRVLVRK